MDIVILLFHLALTISSVYRVHAAPGLTDCKSSLLDETDNLFHDNKICSMGSPSSSALYMLFSIDIWISHPVALEFSPTSAGLAQVVVFFFFFVGLLYLDRPNQVRYFVESLGLFFWDYPGWTTSTNPVTYYLIAMKRHCCPRGQVTNAQTI
jgi:hypothetical protein